MTPRPVAWHERLRALLGRQKDNGDDTMTNGTHAVTLTVQGMHCAACVKRVERALSAVAGVQSVRVDLAEDRAVVQVPEGWAGEAALRDAVRQIGFQVPD